MQVLFKVFVFCCVNINLIGYRAIPLTQHEKNYRKIIFYKNNE